ncbi:hypothetical protein G6F43_006854 [Rhizopus delemar]|nr:hypothetical protein G6F43_006854 [Rhizopus delemar]
MSLNPEVSERKPILVVKSFVLSLAFKSEAPKLKAGSTKPAFEPADQEDTVDGKERLNVVFVGYIALGERVRGKTVETSRTSFETNKRHYVILDPPDHKDFVAGMIQCTF